VAERSKAWVCSRSPAGITGSNSAEGMVVCCKCCVLSGRGLCDGPITRPEESYRLWCIIVCDEMNNNPLHLTWLGRKREVELRKKEVFVGSSVRHVMHTAMCAHRSFVSAQ
jgi:hypothetical protein